MAHDPITAVTVQDASHLEPHFLFPDAEAAADAKLGARAKRPNVALIVFDDVGWGDFGCYGGGVIGSLAKASSSRAATPSRAVRHRERVS